MEENLQMMQNYKIILLEDIKYEHILDNDFYSILIKYVKDKICGFNKIY